MSVSGPGFSLEPVQSEWERGFSAGWAAGLASAAGDVKGVQMQVARNPALYEPDKPKRKRRQSPKQKLLKTMTDAKWKKYKRGSGKKTWVQIRAEVSRSQIYKKKARRLK